MKIKVLYISVLLHLQTRIVKHEFIQLLELMATYIVRSLCKSTHAHKFASVLGSAE